MLTDYWAAYYDDLRRSNRTEEELEDDDFDLDDIQAEMASESEWEDIPHGDAGEVEE